MFRKLAALTLCLVALAAALLVMRQQRIEIANRSAQHYSHIQKTRQAIWHAQGRAALLMRPDDIEQRVKSADLPLEPANPEKPLALRRVFVSRNLSFDRKLFEAMNAGDQP